MFTVPKCLLSALPFSQQGAQRGVDCRVRMRSGRSPPDLPGGARGSPRCLRCGSCPKDRLIFWHKYNWFCNIWMFAIAETYKCHNTRQKGFTENWTETKKLAQTSQSTQMVHLWMVLLKYWQVCSADLIFSVTLCSFMLFIFILLYFNNFEYWKTRVVSAFHKYNIAFPLLIDY